MRKNAESLEAVTHTHTHTQVNFNDIIAKVCNLFNIPKNIRRNLKNCNFYS